MATAFGLEGHIIKLYNSNECAITDKIMVSYLRQYAEHPDFVICVVDESPIEVVTQNNNSAGFQNTTEHVENMEFVVEETSRANKNIEVVNIDNFKMHTPNLKFVVDIVLPTYEVI